MKGKKPSVVVLPADDGRRKVNACRLMTTGREGEERKKRGRMSVTLESYVEFNTGVLR